MHELSIAQAVVDIAVRNARGSSVASVRVRIGHLRQVVPAALEFSFALCAGGTAAEGAVLELEEAPVVIACRACGARSEPSGFPLACEACGGWDAEVVQGEELLVTSLELEGELLRSGG